jgi:prolipoprotein diacylglyceryltransferase
VTDGFRTLPNVPIAVVEFTFDPLVRLLDDLVVRWSTLALAAVIAVTLVILAVIARRDRLRADDLLFIAVGAVPGAVVLGRVGDVLRRPAAYQASPGALFDPTFGGMDLALAVVGGIATATVVANLLGTPVGAWARAAALPLLVLLGAGKLTMVLSGTGQGLPFGDVWATAYLGPGPWGSLAPDLPSYPSQAMEGVAALAIALVLVTIAWVRDVRGDGRRLLLVVALWTAARAGVSLTWRDPAVLGPLSAGGVIALAVAVAAAVGWLALPWLPQPTPAGKPSDDLAWPDPDARPRF